MRVIILMISLFYFSNSITAQIGRLALSPLQKIEQNIAKTNIAIEYSRPSKKDRAIFGGLVPYDTYWRTGANRNTTISFDQDIFIDNVKIKKGKYSIITKPGKSSWEFMLYDETTNWDVPETIDPKKIKCQTSIIPKALDHELESLSISIGDFTNYQFDLVIQWDKTQLTVPIQLDTKETMRKLIANEIDGPTAGDFYSAAVYQLESEKDFIKGLEWIDKAIESREKPVWYDFRVKALLMLEANNTKEIQAVIDRGSLLAEKIDNAYGRSEFERIIGELDRR